MLVGALVSWVIGAELPAVRPPDLLKETFLTAVIN
jgi:hypothetical protein